MRVTQREIAEASREQLVGYLNDLQVAKMKMDKFFSIFLDKAKFDEDNTQTPEWITYREMLKEYGHLNDLIKSTNYRLGRYAIRPAGI